MEFLEPNMFQDPVVQTIKKAGISYANISRNYENVPLVQKPLICTLLSSYARFRYKGVPFVTAAAVYPLFLRVQDTV